MSHKKKNPVPAKQTTLADVTTVEYQGWKATRLLKGCPFLIMQRLKAITFTVDTYVPTRLKQWIEVVDKFGHKHMKKVPAGEGILKEHKAGEVMIVEEYSSRRSYHPIDA